MSKKQKIYTAEFKAEAIKAIESNKRNVASFHIWSLPEFQD